MTLLIYTSTPVIRLGLAKGDRVVARSEFPVRHDLASTLADRIRKFLQATSCQLQTLNTIVVHAGPGGFASLRAGVTTANVFAYALGVPAIGVVGEVTSLDELLDRAKTAMHAPQGIVVPTYGKPPNIGPVAGVMPAS